MKQIAILIALLILTVGFITGCGVSKESYDAAVKEANDCKEQLSEVQADLASAQENLSQINTDLAAAQQNLDSVLADRDSILHQLEETEDDLASAQDQLESADSLITTLQSQITALQSQVDQFQEITDLSLYSIKLDTKTIYQVGNVYENIVSFTADYAGYIVVSGTSSTFNTSIRVTDSFTGYPYNEYLHHFGTGTTLKIPVLPGTITVYISNTNPVGLTATITVVYYY